MPKGSSFTLRDEIKAKTVLCYLGLGLMRLFFFYTVSQNI